MNDLKQLAGQPWSAWKKIIGNASIDPENKDEQAEANDEISSCMRLPRTDMAIYGLCPKTELFQLVVCKHCSNKYKLPALAEHIKLRHSNAESSAVLPKVNQPDKIIQKKGKTKKTKEKPKLKESDGVGKTIIKIDFLEIVSDRQSLPLESETVTKFKQFNIKTNKKNQKSLENDCSKEDSNLSDKGNTVISKNEYVCDISCKNSTDPVWPKAHVQLGNSSIVQDGAIINMQPIVQLSPLSTGSAPALTVSNSNASKTVDENIILNNQPNTNTYVSNERTYNPDIHCGVIDVENGKPCLLYLNCSIHTLALKKAVNGRSKSFDILLNGKKCDSEPKSESPSTPNLDKIYNTNSATSKPSSSKPQTSTSTSISRTEKTDLADENELKNRISTKRVSDRPRLSLPVSIKNPTILCQLQNKVLKSSKFSLPAESTRNDNIQEVLKGNFVLKRTPRVCRGSKENSRSHQKKESTENTETADNFKTTDPKLDRFEQWHPGFRRIGGLLYTSHSIPYINRRAATPPAPPLELEESSSSVLDQTLSNRKDNSKSIDLCSPPVNKVDLRRLQFEVDHGTKKALASLPSKQKGHILISGNSKSQSQKQKLFVSQSSANNNKTVICKRSNNNVNGAVPAKIKKHEGLVNIVGPVFGKNEHAVPVMHLEMANNIFEKPVMTTPHVPTPNSLGTSVQSGLNVIRGSSLRIGPPRIHYITASGPLPVSIQQVASVQQLQLKPMRVQHKYQLVSPQVNITPTSGVFYIQKTPTSSSNIQCNEER